MLIEKLDPEKPSFRPSKWPQKLKIAKNSKFPKLTENCFEPVGKSGWPLISTWITQEPVAKEEENKTAKTPENSIVTQEPVVPDLNMQSKKDIQEFVIVTQEPMMAKTVETTHPKSTTATQEPLVPNLN